MNFIAATLVLREELVKRFNGIKILTSAVAVSDPQWDVSVQMIVEVGVRVSAGIAVGARECGRWCPTCGNRCERDESKDGD